MKKIFTLLFIALAMVGCTNHEEKDEIVLPVLNETFYASFADSEELSRTYIDEDIKLLWHADDRISLFRTTLNEEFAFTGETGDNSGGFNAVPSDSWVTGNQVSTNYAVYPYLASTRLSNQEVLTVEMPAVQQYAENSFGRGANTMVAASESSSSRFLPFRNLGGYLVVKLYGENTKIKSIELAGNNDEVLAGKATVQAKYGYLPAITMSEEGSQTITLDCGDGVELSADEANPTLFWLVVPPVTFEGGFTFTITDINDNTFTKSTTKKQTIERNGVKSMAAFQSTFEGDAEDPAATKPANNEIWYTNGSTTEATVPYATDVFGANIVSNTYDAEKECWVIKFDGDVSQIGFEAFRDCTSLTSITIPDSVTSIGNGAFDSCYSLASATIGNGVTSIEDYAFFSCTPLTSITIPDSVTSIGDRTFEGCASLTSVTIGNSVTSIGKEVFCFCTSLTTFYGKFASADNRCLVVDGKLEAFAIGCGLTEYSIPEGVTSIEESVCWGCTSLESITIPDSVTSIGASAFQECLSLTSITIGNGVTSIGEGAFDHCTSLDSITIPDSVKLIGNYAFSCCHLLTSVTIPEGVTSIGLRAFSGCNSLKGVYCKSTTPPTLGSEAFDDNAADRKIYVPASDDDSVINAYKAKEYWDSYATSIEELKPLSNEIWYTNGSTTEATVPFRADEFGANIVLNTYDAEKECWVIKFDGDVGFIGYNAFQDCTSLMSIMIPDGVDVIGHNAFTGCTSLISVTIPDSVVVIHAAAFMDCTSLKSITIPDSVTSIGGEGSNAFYRCTSLTTFYGKFASDDNRCLIVDGVLKSFAIGSGLTEYTIPEGVTSIGPFVFTDCTSLTSVTIPDSVTSIGSSAFNGCASLTSVIIGNGVTSIGSSVFSNCTSLTSITIPNGVTSIGDRAFNRCTSLTSITIPNGVTSIGSSVFSDCTSLKSIAIPDRVTSIGDSAFSGCDSLTSIIIPDSVTSIGSSAFSSCDSLTNVVIPEGVTSIGEGIFSYCNSLTAFYGKFASADNRYLVVDGVLNSFAPSGLTTYTIPDSIISIGGCAFYGCHSLTSITIPDSVTSIGRSAFCNCRLANVTIGNSVISIGEKAFFYCTLLKEVYCTSTTPPTLGSKAFDSNATDRKIYVPASDDDSVIDAYKAKEYWSSYATSIEEYSF